MCTDNLKWTFPIAVSTLQIAWGVVSLPEGVAPSQAMISELTWATEYLIACKITNDSLVSQVKNFIESPPGTALLAGLPLHRMVHRPSTASAPSKAALELSCKRSGKKTMITHGL